MTERADRIMKYFHDNLIEGQSIENTISEFIHALARDFPQFMTAEKPNEWERGYYTVIETLHDIALEIKNNKRI